MRPAAAADRDPLAGFTCRRTDRDYDVEVESMIQGGILDHALQAPTERRLLLFEDEGERLVAVAAHEPGETPGETPGGSRATYLLVVAVASEAQGREVAGSAGQEPQKLWRRVMGDLILDVVRADRGPFVYAVTHRRNDKGLHMLREFEIRTKLPLEIAGQKVPGYLTMLGRLP
jgi:hypothetical protein